MQATHRLLLAAALGVAAASALNATPAEARGYVTIYATTEPPPLRAERVPPPRHGYVWAPGYWAWSGHRYSWRHGYWVRERHGYHYAPARWERDGHRWRYYGGRWER